MKTSTRYVSRTLQALAVAVGLSVAASAHAAQLLNFQFNEGSGLTTTDSANGFTGLLGVQQNPAVDYVQLIQTSPSGAPGDGCITNSGNGFLIADDSATQVLNITNGPITLETWIFIDPFTPAKAAEGIIAYGGSYKMGMKGGYQVFTLFGYVDITNSAAGQVPVAQWVHLAAAWEPGVGVHFYMNGVENFVANTTYSAARPVQHNYLSIASEGLGNTSVAAFDRVRIHHALLSAGDLDSDAGNPKAPLASTLVSYNFNEASFPSTNAILPLLPTGLSSDFLPELTSPVWTNDTPTGLAGDFAFSFLNSNPVNRPAITVDLSSSPLDLGANNTNYTLQAWIKLPPEPMEERRVIYRSDGPAPRISLSVNANRTMHTTVLGTADFTTSVGIPNDGRWHHVAIVMEDFLRVRFYLDGILRQTVNRTQTGAASSGGTPSLLIGKESESRYFNGLLDRVIINNDALTNSTLDFPAIPGLPTFPTLASHPADTVAAAGSTVVFTAEPSSPTAATYQWRYRTNLNDTVSVALPGETGTTLTLNNINESHLGYYFLAVTNATGGVESYAARLSFPIDLSAKLFDFEAPTYVSGPIEEQDGWTNDQNGSAARVLTEDEIEDYLIDTGRTPGETVHSGSQALLISGASLATTTIRPVTGLETEQNVTLDVWVRPLAIGTLGNAIGNVFLTMENATGVRAAAFRIGPGFSIDYGSTNSGVWVASGMVANPDEWVHLTMELDYATRYYDFFINGVKANAEPIRFYTPTSESFRQIRIFRGANQAGMIVDDLNLPAPIAGIEITNISVVGTTVTINWEGGQGPYQLQRRSSLTSGTWQNVGGTTALTEATDTITPADTMMFYRVIESQGDAQ